jgi:hypothetical protein
LGKKKVCEYSGGGDTIFAGVMEDVRGLIDESERMLEAINNDIANDREEGR